MLEDFGVQAGGWHLDRHPRFLADTTGDGLLSCVTLLSAVQRVSMGGLVTTDEELDIIAVLVDAHPLQQTSPLLRPRFQLS